MQGPPPMNFDEAGKHGPTWKKQFNIIFDRTDETDEIKAAVFLHHLGPKGKEIYDTMRFQNAQPVIVA